MEEFRQWAAMVAELHYVIGLIVERAGELVPGEAIDELDNAWHAAQGSMKALVGNLYPADDANRLGTLKNLHTEGPPQPPAASGPAAPPQPQNVLEGEIDLRDSQLLGPVGELKRSTWRRLKDQFLMLLFSKPGTEDKTARTRDAACECLDLAATVVGSMPGYHKVVEFVSLTKQLVGIRNKRGV
jgi:hypothetical protein